MSDTVCAIRTNRWNADAERLHKQLAPVFGEDLVVVFHDRKRGVRPPLPIVDINGRWVRRAGLSGVGDWGWRCGDYFYYRLREARPDYSYYWLIEPDVYFGGDPARFFEAFFPVEDDALAYRMIRIAKGAMRFARQMPDMEYHRAIYALTRLSGRAIDFLREQRVAYSRGAARGRFFANDEVFSMSHLVANEDLSVGALEARAPDWFANGYFDTAPDMLCDNLSASDAGPAIYHPAHARDEFKAAVASRVVRGAGFLDRMRPSFQGLSEADVEDIVGRIADGYGQRLRALAAAPAAKNLAEVEE